MNKNSFIFDSNKCVGCMTCVAGCTIENKTETPLNWRVVNGFNKIKHPDLPVFHFSLACNHCEDAPCMKNCPALAYSRDKKTGAIIHKPEACIGCTYCTWACPYDAPKFNEKTKIIEKCNFCIERITEGKKTACAQACPVGALNFSSQEEVDFSKHLMPGFVNADIKPSIQLIPLRKENEKPKIENIDAPNVNLKRAEKYLQKVKSKVDLEKEWTLILFTITASILIAWQASGVINQVAISPVVFSSLFIASVLLTSFHIGKKLRMFRFVFNLKGSWLSREILSFSTFFGFGTASLLVKHNIWDLEKLFPFLNTKILDYIAILFGFLTLLSIDMVYRLLKRKENCKIHSSMVLLTGMLLFGWFTKFWLLIGFITLFKGGLYIHRKLFLRNHNFEYYPILSFFRMLTLFLPFISFVLMPEISLWILLPMVFLSEIIDRSEFYHEAEVRTPQTELIDLFSKQN